MQNRDYVNYEHVKPTIEIPTKVEAWGWVMVVIGVGACVLFTLGAF